MGDKTDIKPPELQGFLYLFGIAAVCFFLGFGFRSKTQLRFGYETVEGRIRSSSVTRNLHQIQGGVTTKIDYTVRVSYEYTVDNQSYVGDRIYIDVANHKTSAEDDARQLAEQFPKGKTVTVYYSKAAPDTACLQLTGFPWFQLVLLLIGAIAALGFVASTVQAIKYAWASGRTS
jgi:hypothetical protein